MRGCVSVVSVLCEEHFREAMGLLKKGYNEQLPGAPGCWASLFVPCYGRDAHSTSKPYWMYWMHTCVNSFNQFKLTQKSRDGLSAVSTYPRDMTVPWPWLRMDDLTAAFIQGYKQAGGPVIVD